MKKFKKYKKFLPAVLAAIILIFLIGASLLFKNSQNSPQTLSDTEEATPTVNLEIFESSVEIKLPDSEEFSEITNNQEIPAGTKVKTNESGRAQVVYENGSVTRIDHNSEITLEKFETENFKVKVKLTNGRIWSRVAKLLGKEEVYQTETENLVATIRGTSYGHEILENGQDKITVTKGEVNGECLNKTQDSQIPKDRKVIFDCSSDRKVFPLFLTYGDRQNEWFIFNNKEDEKLNERFSPKTYADQEITIKKVLGNTTAPSPTNKPTSTSTSTPTSTSTTSNSTPTPTPTPTPPAITITSVSVSSKTCSTLSCEVAIKGAELGGVSFVEAKNVKGTSVRTTSDVIRRDSSLIYATFTKLSAGEYYIRIGNVQSPNTFLIVQTPQ